MQIKFNMDTKRRFKWIIRNDPKKEKDYQKGKRSKWIIKTKQDLNSISNRNISQQTTTKNNRKYSLSEHTKPPPPAALLLLRHLFLLLQPGRLETLTSNFDVNSNPIQNSLLPLPAAPIQETLPSPSTPHVLSLSSLLGFPSLNIENSTSSPQ